LLTGIQLRGLATNTSWFHADGLTKDEARRIAANVVKLSTRYNLPRRYSLIPAHIANTMRTPIAI
jgi:hypothetical protein